LKLLIATKNKNKLREIKNKLKILKFEILSLFDFPDADDIEEDCDTFIENAKKKAKYFAKKYNILALADDSGLGIDYLSGIPGVKSKRFANTDSERIERILNLMKNVKFEKRKANFICAIAVSDASGKTFEATGICDGYIAENARGQNGFGYDPIFYLPEISKTMAELDLEEKNKISHRAKALDKIIEILKKPNKIAL